MTKLPFGHKISQDITTWDEVCLEMILEKYPDCDQKAVENYLKFVADGKQVNGKLEGHHTLMRADFPQYTRKRIGNAQLGRHPSLELRKLWSKRRKGRVVSQKTRDKISASHFLMHQKRRENVI
jgi:hypothetical protein